MADPDRLAFQILNANPALDLYLAAFHASQAVQKFLKTLLVTQGKVFPPTHDLGKQAGSLRADGALQFLPAEQQRKLNPYADLFRYDDRSVHTLSREEISALVETVCE